MTAYVIADTEIVDRVAGARYRELAQRSIEQYGGRYIVRGGADDAVEGGWHPKLFVVVEFPSMDRARQWYRSPEYAEALELRQTALRRRLIFVEGVEAPTEGANSGGVACRRAAVSVCIYQRTLDNHIRFLTEQLGVLLQVSLDDEDRPFASRSPGAEFRIGQRDENRHRAPHSLKQLRIEMALFLAFVDRA